MTIAIRVKSEKQLTKVLNTLYSSGFNWYSGDQEFQPRITDKPIFLHPVIRPNGDRMIAYMRKYNADTPIVSSKMFLKAAAAGKLCTPPNEESPVCMSQALSEKLPVVLRNGDKAFVVADTRQYGMEPSDFPFIVIRNTGLPRGSDGFSATATGDYYEDSSPHECDIVGWWRDSLDWSKVDPSAKAIAADSTGKVYFFSVVPVRNDNEWLSGAGLVAQVSSADQKDIGYTYDDWSTSLAVRPLDE